MDDNYVEYSNSGYTELMHDSYRKSSADPIERIDIRKVRERAIKKEKERTKKILKIVIPIVIVASTMTGAWLNNAHVQRKYNSDMVEASQQYDYIVNDNTHGTLDNSGHWYDTTEIGLAISDLPENERDLAIFSLVTKIMASGGSMSNADTVVRIVSNGQFEGFDDYALKSFGIDTSTNDYYNSYEAALATVYNARQIQSGLNEEKTGGQK